MGTEGWRRAAILAAGVWLGTVSDGMAVDPACDLANHAPDTRFSVQRSDTELLGYESQLIGADAHTVMPLLTEALGHFGIAERSIQFHKESSRYRVTFDATVPPEVREHVIFHAERWNLRDASLVMQNINHRAREMLMHLPPEVAWTLMKELSLTDFMVLNQWHINRDTNRVENDELRQLLSKLVCG